MADWHTLKANYQTLMNIWAYCQVASVETYVVLLTPKILIIWYFNKLGVSRLSIKGLLTHNILKMGLVTHVNKKIKIFSNEISNTRKQAKYYTYTSLLTHVKKCALTCGLSFLPFIYIFRAYFRLIMLRFYSIFG